jgi:hypothetical protein
MKVVFRRPTMCGQAWPRYSGHYTVVGMSDRPRSTKQPGKRAYLTLDELQAAMSVDKEVEMLSEAVRSAIDHQRPFALARYGDGEARLLLQQPGSQLCPMADHVFRGTMAYLGPLTPLMVLRFQDSWLEACRDVDVHLFQTNPWLNNISAWFLTEMQERGSISRGAICLPIRASGHRWRERLKGLLGHATDVVLITCRPGAALGLELATGVRVRTTIPLPSEGKQRRIHGGGGEGSQFPHVMRRILTEVIPSVVRPGTVVLLGVGPPKPLYCKAVKDAGGIAIDVGSWLDELAGRITRGSSKWDATARPPPIAGVWTGHGGSDSGWLGSLVARRLARAAAHSIGTPTKDRSLVLGGEDMSVAEGERATFVGAGVPRGGVSINAGCRVLCVRGPLASAAHAQRPATPWVTDPLVLTSRAIPRTLPSPDHEVAIVLGAPDQALLKAIENGRFPVRVGMGDSFEDALSFILSARTVVTTLPCCQVIAHSYGVAAIGISCTEDADKSFRFKDYYASLHDGSIDGFSLLRCADGQSVEAAASAAWCPDPALISSKQDLLLRLLESPLCATQ